MPWDFTRPSWLRFPLIFSFVLTILLKVAQPLGLNLEVQKQETHFRFDFLWFLCPTIQPAARIAVSNFDSFLEVIPITEKVFLFKTQVVSSWDLTVDFRLLRYRIRCVIIWVEYFPYRPFRALLTFIQELVWWLFKVTGTLWVGLRRFCEAF